MSSSSWKFLSFLLILFIFLSSSSSNIFTITNNCPYTIWPGTLSGSGSPPLPATRFQLNSGQSPKITSVLGWSGRIWGRTGCNFDTTGIGNNSDDDGVLPGLLCHFPPARRQLFLRSGDSAGGNIAGNLAGRLGRGLPELAPVRVRGSILLTPFFSGTVRNQLEAELKPEGPKDTRFMDYKFLLR